MESCNKIVSVTTAKESFEKYQVFIEENRRAGIDHFFIFYEGELHPKLPELYGDFVTFISSTEINPAEKNLNRRQIKNLNLAIDYLRFINYDGYVANIDSDEFLYLDKSLLSSNVPAILLNVAEPVVGETAIYKKALSDIELELAVAAGVLEAGDGNESWLNGYITGKYLARPKDIGTKCRWSIHGINGVDLADLGMYVIHRESYDVASFKEKFLRHVDNVAGFRDKRRRIVNVFTAFKDEENFDAIVEHVFNNEFFRPDQDLKDVKVGVGLYFELPDLLCDCENIQFHYPISSYIDNEYREVAAELIEYKHYADIRIEDIKTKEDIDYVRDLAISLEDSCLSESLRLMSLALQLRPDGPNIQRKVAEYKKRMDMVPAS